MTYLTIKASIVLLSSTLSTGCGMDVMEPFMSGLHSRMRIVDKELEPHVSSFESILGKRIKFNVLFTTLEPTIAGKCSKYTNGDREVYIDRNQYNAMSEVRREILIYHELGHCVLNKYHNDQRIVFKGESSSAPASILNSILFSEDDVYFYQKYKVYYINELFGR